MEGPSLSSRLNPLPKSFYGLKTPELAKQLLGCFLATTSRGVTTIGRIVETEAYLFEDDPACHAHKGETARNRTMFGPAGFAYVYLIYGMYYCFNVVSSKEGHGEAVLVRALEPLSGIEAMKRRRKTTDIRRLCDGPGKLSMAMGITKRHDGACLTSSNVRLYAPDKNLSKNDIFTTTRIGITLGADLPLRYYLRESPFVSKIAQ